MGRFTNTTRVNTARFRLPGASVAGVVTKIEDVAAPEFVDGRIVGPKFNADGSIVKQTDVTILTEDDTETVIHTGVGIAIAIGQALAKLGDDVDLAVGDTLSVTYVSDEDTDGDFDTKVYEAVVTKSKVKKD